MLALAKKAQEQKDQRKQEQNEQPKLIQEPQNLQIKEKSKVSAAWMRVQKDIAEFDLPKQIKVEFADQTNIMEQTIKIKPDEGYWAGSTITFIIRIPQEYPISPPKIQCMNKIFHPNIDYDGKVCLNILREDWKPVLTLNGLLLGVLFLFLEPNNMDPLNKEAAEMMTKSQSEFQQIVRSTMKGNSYAGKHYDKLS